LGERLWHGRPPATALLELVENGRIQLDAPIQEDVPQFPPKPWPVTVRQLPGHLGGIRHYQDDEIAGTRHYLNREDPLRILAAGPLAYEPGSRYLYSTYGFNLLGTAVDLVSGMPVTDYRPGTVRARAERRQAAEARHG
jgi:serine beta-lactamase-like protein LACTB, mitochondrial